MPWSPGKLVLDQSLAGQPVSSETRSTGTPAGEELRRARPLKAEHHVELLRDHGRHEHRQADAEHPAPALGILLAVVVIEDAQHEEEGHCIERAQIREGHQIEQSLALPDQMIEEEKDRAVESIPEAHLPRKQPAREEQDTENREAQDTEPSFCRQEIILLSRKTIVSSCTITWHCACCAHSAARRDRPRPPHERPWPPAADRPCSHLPQRGPAHSSPDARPP